MMCLLEKLVPVCWWLNIESSLSKTNSLNKFHCSWVHGHRQWRWHLIIVTSTSFILTQQLVNSRTARAHQCHLSFILPFLFNKLYGFVWSVAKHVVYQNIWHASCCVADIAHGWPVQFCCWPKITAKYWYYPLSHLVLLSCLIGSLTDTLVGARIHIIINQHKPHFSTPFPLLRLSVSVALPCCAGGIVLVILLLQHWLQSVELVWPCLVLPLRGALERW